MNVNLGPPYESIMKRLIEKGYAGNQTELIRQALILMEREVAEEEALLVHKGGEIEMAEIKAKKTRTYSLDEVLKEASLS